MKIRNQNKVDLYIHTSFTIFIEDRTRFGIKIQVNLVFLLSPFTIFVEDRRRFGIKI